eukprot:s3183_g16.t1
MRVRRSSPSSSSRRGLPCACWSDKVCGSSPSACRLRIFPILFIPPQPVIVRAGVTNRWELRLGYLRGFLSVGSLCKPEATSRLLRCEFQRGHSISSKCIAFAHRTQSLNSLRCLKSGSMMQHCFRTSLDIACHGSASFESSSMSYALRTTATVATAALSFGIPTTDRFSVWYALQATATVATAALSFGIPTTDSSAVWYALRVARASAALSSGIPTTDSHAVWYALRVARASAALSSGIRTADC